MRFSYKAFLLVGMVIASLNNAQALETAARTAVIRDFTTGRILFEKDSHTRVPTASMSKMMTMYMVFDALKKGDLHMDQMLPVSERAWKSEGSRSFLNVGSQAKVEDLIRGVIIQSGNDATVVFAEGLAGSETAFAERMNKKLAELGIKDSHFVNASGLPEPDHYSTAFDLLMIGEHLIRDFPDDYKFYSEKDFTYNDTKQGNRNPLLYANIGADGIKTGHTKEAGYGLVGSAVQNGQRISMVVTGLPSMAARKDESIKLMDWAFKSFHLVNVFKPGQKVADAEVWLGQSPRVNLTVAKELPVALGWNEKDSVKAKIEFQEPLPAPLTKGQEVGKLTVELPGMEAVSVPLVAAEDVAIKGGFDRAMAAIKGLLKS
ncbi:MAG: D-alanyl-D-alanine carboxypeptidase family protein [Alphaproteobacteria bacterium]